MPKKARRAIVMLPSVPVTVAASTGMAGKHAFHQPGVAIGLAAITGTLAVLGVVLVSAEAQETIRTWIRYRTEHRLSAAEAYERRRRVRAATRGGRWTSSGKHPSTRLPEIMRITRMEILAEPGPARGDASHSLLQQTASSSGEANSNDAAAESVENSTRTGEIGAARDASGNS